MITFRLIGVAPESPFAGTVSMADSSADPAGFIRDFVGRWYQQDPSLPRIIRVTGLSDEPIECNVEDLPSHAFLFPKSE